MCRRDASRCRPRLIGDAKLADVMRVHFSETFRGQHMIFPPTGDENDSLVTGFSKKRSMGNGFSSTRG
ncbi:hypothetical protein B4113_1351 [Geobacillus sp. B4113_201601]|nr:hypothetical protein B4113_1351 [Geobacillus sp. B4113_201601]